MRLLKQGELYGLDKKNSVSSQLETAKKKFRKKHGREPLEVCWNPGKDFATVDLGETVDRTIPPGTIWLELGENRG